MSRYDVEKFHPPPDPELICCICQCVLDNAKESPCRHVFCKVCIEQWLNDHNSCPTCRTWLSKRDLQNVLPLVQNMINKLVMYCDYRSNGCEEKLVLEIYDAHVLKCDFKSLQCTNLGCTVSLLLKDFSQHVNHTCEFREVTCNKGCHLKIPINDLSFHNCMIALKQKTDKQQKLIEEFSKKIQELVSLKELLKRKVENLLRNIDPSTPPRGESGSALFSSSSYEEDEDIAPVDVVPRGGRDNTDARLSVISNYFEFYANAVDRITSDVSQIQSEASLLFDSGFRSAENSNTLSHLESAGHTPFNFHSRRGRHRRSTQIHRQSSLDPMDRDQYSLHDTYVDMSLDQETNVPAVPISPSTTAETVSGSTGTEDRYNLNDMELDVAYVADSEDGNNSATEYTYYNVSDNGIFESDDDEEDEDDDYDDVPSDVSSSIQSSLLANVHSESPADEAEPHNNLRNLCDDIFTAEFWSEHSNVNQSTEGTDIHPPSEAVPPESDNASDGATTEVDSYLQQSDENYLSSNYISSPSVTSVQYSPLLSSSPFHDSESEIFEHNVVTYSDLSEDDEVNHDIELVLDTSAAFSTPTTENISHQTGSINTRSDNSHVISDDDGSDENDDDENSAVYHSLAVSDGPSSPEVEQSTDGQNSFCEIVSPSYLHSLESSTNSLHNGELSEEDTTHVRTSNSRHSRNDNDSNINNSLEHLERSAQTSVYQQRQRYIEMNSEPPVTTSGHHNHPRFPQTGKESLRFSQRVLFDNAEINRPVSIKIEPNSDTDQMSSNPVIPNIRKRASSTRMSYDARVTQCCPQIGSTCTGDIKPIPERLLQTDVSNRYPLPSQRTISNMHAIRCSKRSNSSSTENRSRVKRHRTRDYSNYNTSTPTASTAAMRNRVDLSVINVREAPGQTLPPKRHRRNAASTTPILTSTIASNSLPAASCTYGPPIMLNSSRQSVPSGSRTRRSQRRSTRDWQVNAVQPDLNDIRVVEERTLSSASESVMGGGQTFHDRRHSHRSEYNLEQQVESDDDASYEPSDSYSSDETDGQDTDSSYEVLVPKSISQLLEEYDSEETDESWTFDMA